MAAGQEERLLWGEKRAPEVRERRTALPTRFPSGSDVPDPMRPRWAQRSDAHLQDPDAAAGSSPLSTARGHSETEPCSLFSEIRSRRGCSSSSSSSSGGRSHPEQLPVTAPSRCGVTDSSRLLFPAALRVPGVSHQPQFPAAPSETF